MKKKMYRILAGFAVTAVLVISVFIVQTNRVYAESVSTDLIQPISIDEESSDEQSQTQEDESDSTRENVVELKAVTGLQVDAAKTTRLVVTWESCEYAARYEVYRKEKKSDTVYEKIAETVDEQFIDKNVKKNTNYIYRIVAIYNINEKTVTGKPSTVVYNYKEQIPVVSHLKTDSRSDKSVEVFWDENSAASKYEVYRKDAGAKQYKLLATVKKASYIDQMVTFGKKYVYKVIPIHTSGDYTLAGTAATVSFKNMEFVNTKHQYYTYAEMKEDLKLLEAKYARHCRVDVIGSSVNNRKIYDVVIGDPDAPESLLVVSTLHSREYIASMLCMEQIEYYLRNYNHTIDGKKVSEVFDNVNVHYVVMANPDGVMLSQTKYRYLKNNANNVNLNANFPYGFVASPTHGEYAASEPETQAIMSLCEKLKKEKKLQAVFNYHAMGQIVFGRYSGSNGYIKNMTTKMYWVARNTTGYADEGNYSSSTGKSGGSFRDYNLYTLKVPSVTVEVGSVSCPVPYSYMPTIFRQNRYLILREAALFL